MRIDRQCSTCDAECAAFAQTFSLQCDSDGVIFPWLMSHRVVFKLDKQGLDGDLQRACLVAAVSGSVDPRRLHQPIRDVRLTESVCSRWRCRAGDAQRSIPAVTCRLGDGLADVRWPAHSPRSSVAGAGRPKRGSHKQLACCSATCKAGRRAGCLDISRCGVQFVAGLRLPSVAVGKAPTQVEAFCKFMLIRRCSAPVQREN